MLCITEKICKEILKCYDTNLCKMGSFAVRKTLMCRTDQLKKNLISINSTYHLRGKAGMFDAIEKDMNYFTDFKLNQSIM